MPYKLTTGDPYFNPNKPVEINGFLFIPVTPALRGPAAELRKGDHLWMADRIMLADMIDPPGPKGWPEGPKPDVPAERSYTGPELRKGGRYVAPPRPAFEAGYQRPCNVRQEGDEYVCATCARRWGLDDERPYCENDPAWKG